MDTEEDKELGTDGTGMLRISERTFETGDKLCPSFIDWQKMFYRVKWAKLMQILKVTSIN